VSVCNEFRENVLKQLEELNGQEDGLVLVDDLSVLLSLGVNSREIYALIQDIRVICLERHHTLAIASHFPHIETDDEAEDEELNRLVASIGHECDIWLDIDKTRTGFSAQIDGTLKIHTPADNLTNPCKEFQFKYADRNVKIISSGVI